MEILPASELAIRSCQACEGGVDPVSLDQARSQLIQLPGWSLVADGKKIRRHWKLKNFLQGLALFQKVAVVAEAEAHHPDLHLENYRDAIVEIWTHSIGGLSMNDFILAAKIDEVAREFAVAKKQ